MRELREETVNNRNSRVVQKGKIEMVVLKKELAGESETPRPVLQ